MWIVWAPSAQKYGMGAVKLFFTVKQANIILYWLPREDLKGYQIMLGWSSNSREACCCPEAQNSRLTAPLFHSCRQVRQSIYVLGIITTKWIQSICSSEVQYYKGRHSFCTQFLVMRHQDYRCITFLMSHYTTNYYIHNTILKFDWLRNIAIVLILQSVTLF